MARPLPLTLLAIASIGLHVLGLCALPLNLYNILNNLVVVRGAVFDVAVDIRRSSSTFGQWVGVELSEENNRQLWVPPGFAHGFLVLSESADFLYKTTDYYAPEHERCLLWNDPSVAVQWPVVEGAPLLSGKDQAGLTLDCAEVFA